MSLLQRFFARDFSKKFRSGTGHTHVRSLLITIPSSNETSGFASERKHLAWEFWPGFLSKNPCLLSQHPFGESTILLFFKGSLVKPVSACSDTALVTAQLSTLWTGKKKIISELIRLFLLSFFGDGGVRFEPAQYFYLNMGVKLVMVKDQSLARRSVLLEYDCGANALG